MQKPIRKNTRQETLLRTFWVVLTFVMLAVAVALFEAREDSRALVFSGCVGHNHQRSPRIQRGTRGCDVLRRQGLSED